MSLAVRQTFEEVVAWDNELLATYVQVFEDRAEEIKRKSKPGKELDPRGEEALTDGRGITAGNRRDRQRRTGNGGA